MQSTVVQGFVTIANICAMLFVIVAGGYLGFKNGWPGYELPTGYFPFGVDGMLAGASTVFFSYIGFDSVASTAEEVKNPQRDLPLGIGLALAICCTLYMLVSAVIVGLVPYYTMDPDTPISSAFASLGVHWASYVVTIGACTALCSTLMGSILPQVNLFIAVSRVGEFLRKFAMHKRIFFSMILSHGYLWQWLEMGCCHHFFRMSTGVLKFPSRAL
nr:cationic amino acid transporter 2, vacuolar-like [Ipomoea batatas]